MNKRIDYKFKALVLRMLLSIFIKLNCHDDDLEAEVRECRNECEAISDGRHEI